MNALSFKKCLFGFAALILSIHVWAQGPGVIAFSDLPVEAKNTLALIKQGGPFPYAKDGAIFGNHEQNLPKRKRGYYHEFTVKTPGVRNRGARRIIVAGEPVASQERYYTEDHYVTFRRIQE